MAIKKWIGCKCKSVEAGPAFMLLTASNLKEAVHIHLNFLQVVFNPTLRTRYSIEDTVCWL